MSDRVRNFEAPKGKRGLQSESRIEISERQTAIPKTAQRGSKSRMREEHGSGNESISGASSPEMKRSKVNLG